VEHGVYAEGPEPPTSFEMALSKVVASGGVASGALAAALHALDSIYLKPPYATVPSQGRPERGGIKRQDLFLHSIVDVDGIPCTNGLQTMIDLAHRSSDRTWEQALESALRKGLVTIADLDLALNRLGRSRTPGTRRIRRVLQIRPDGAPPTDSLLETLMVQLIREHTNLPDPTRQFTVGAVADPRARRLDLAYPDHGLFIELDGEHHLGQPVYDARRETEVVAKTGWLPGRFTWTEVTRAPIPTARRVEELFARATPATFKLVNAGNFGKNRQFHRHNPA
jgi:hypothetical protein